MAELTLHGVRLSQHTRRVVALLEQAGLAYTLKSVDLDRGAHRQAPFIQLNPNGQVPVLEHEGLVLWESHAILRYLCNRFALTDWYPVAVPARALVDQWLDFSHCRLLQPVTTVALDALFPEQFGNPTAATSAKAEIQQHLRVMSSGLRQQSWFGGAQPGIADLSLGSQLDQLALAGYEPELPVAVGNWRAALAELPGVQAAQPALTPA